jgi:hypothetical protein
LGLGPHHYKKKKEENEFKVMRGIWMRYIKMEAKNKHFLSGAM